MPALDCHRDPAILILDVVHMKTERTGATYIRQGIHVGIGSMGPWPSTLHDVPCRLSRNGPSMEPWTRYDLHTRGHLQRWPISISAGCTRIDSAAKTEEWPVVSHRLRHVIGGTTRYPRWQWQPRDPMRVLVQRVTPGSDLCLCTFSST